VRPRGSNAGPPNPYSKRSIAETNPPMYLEVSQHRAVVNRIIVSKGSTRPSGCVKSIDIV
jgi:hypothetical protein